MKLNDVSVAVLVEDMYEDLELWYPVYRLREEGAVVALVGPAAGKAYSSKHGYPAISDRSAVNLSSDDFDAVVIPGGYAPDRMRRDPSMVQFVGDMARADKMVAAICHAGWMLCSAGVVEGRKVTSFFAIKDDLVNAGAEWVDEEVVRDGNLITSRQPDDLPAFLRTIVECLQHGAVAAKKPVSV